MSILVRKNIGPSLLVAGISLCLATNSYFNENDTTRYSSKELKEDLSRISNFEAPSDDGKLLGLSILGIGTLIPGMIYSAKRTYINKS